MNPLLPVLCALFFGATIAVIALLTSKYWMSDLGRFLNRLKSNVEDGIEEFKTAFNPPEDSSKGE